MSKKLIAVASAAALAVSLLVAAPASATAATITFTAAGGGTGTSATPYLAPVPQLNTIVDANSMKVVVANVAAGDTVTITATAPARVLSAEVSAASTLVNVSTLGTQNYTKTVSGSATTDTVWVQSTSSSVTSTVTVTVSETDSGVKTTRTSSVSFKGVTGTAYNLSNVTVPSTLAASADADVTFNVVDAFGNVVETNVAAAATVTAGSVLTTGAATWDATRKLHVVKLTAPANTSPFVVSLDGNGATADPANIGLGATSVTASLVVNNPAAATANASAVAQIAALTAQLANSRAKDASVTKKRFNTLARKWNRAFPSQAVKLKR